MDVSSDLAIIAILLAGICMYIAFLLWTPKAKRNNPSNRFTGFLIGFMLSILLGFVFFLGCVLGGILFMWLGSIVSYAMGAICGVLLCAYTIKILPSKIDNRAVLDSFSIFAFAIYIILGIGELLSISSWFSLLGDGIFNLVVTGIANIGVALCAAVIPNLQKKSAAKSAPVSVTIPESTPASADMQAEIDAPLDSAASIIVPEPDCSVPAMPSVSAPEPSASTHVSVHFSINKRILFVLAVLVALCVGLGVGILLGEGYFAPQFTPSSPYIESVSSSAYADGYSKGYDTGRERGNREGMEKGQSDGLFSGYSNGYSDGYDDGYSSGYNDGFDDGYYGY